MRTRSFISLMFLIAVCSLQTVAAFGLFENRDPSVLAKVHVVNLELTGLQSDFKRYGLDWQDLRKEIIKRITAAGLEVTGSAEAEQLADAYLMEVRIYRNKTDAFTGNSFTVTIKIKEKVPLQPGGGSWILREIWWDWKIGSVPYNDLRYLQKYTLELVDHFAEVYRKERFGY